jgi:hypothetical protein
MPSVASISAAAKDVGISSCFLCYLMILLSCNANHSGRAV